jgi:trimeric autotransporter adhesin
MSNAYVSNNSGGGGGGGVIQTIAGDTGTITGAAVTIFAHNSTNNSGASVFFTNSGTVSTLNLTDSNFNTFLGNTAGNATVSADGASNVGVGVEAMISATTANQSVAIGGAALGSVTTGQGNTSMGYRSGGITTGSNNLFLGILAGNNLNSSESNNILIGNTGVIGDGSVTRIGTRLQQTKAFVGGITGNTITNTPMMVTIDNSGGATDGQLGVAAIPSGGSVTLTGDIGSPITGSSLTVFANTATLNAGSSVSFSNDGVSTSTFNVSDSGLNTIIGSGSGSAAILSVGGQNVSVGSLNIRDVGGNFLTNMCLGLAVLATATAASHNIGIGANTLGAGDNFNFNIAIGDGALGAGSNGCTGNISIGISSGVAYVGAESNNILINNPGVATESGVTRIGTTGLQDACFMAGITGVTNAGSVVLVGPDGQLTDLGFGTVGQVLTSAGPGLSPIWV